MGERKTVPGQGNRGGRPKGAKNKTSLAFKEALVQTFDNLGGVTYLTTWAEENPTEFMKIMAKLLPAEITGKDGGDIKHTITVVVKRDRNFFGRSLTPRTAGTPDTDPRGPGPLQGGGVRPPLGEDGVGVDGGD